MKTQCKIAFGIVAVLTGTIISSLALPKAQAPQSPGILILKDQLVFAGYETPEATLESFFWAIANGDYDVAIASAPKESAVKIYGRDSAQFKKEWQSGEFQNIASLQIIARKNLTADKVELEFQMLSAGQTDEQSEPGILALVKADNKWTLDFRTVHGPPVNWDSGKDVVVFVPRKKAVTGSKSLDAIGIVISRNRLANVGYGTPEATLETHTWAMASTNYDKLLESVTPEIRATAEKDASGRERFESGINKGISSVEKLHILARKTIADDRVELKVVTEQKQKDSIFAVVTIEQLTKTGNEWKYVNSRTYDPAWDKDSQPVDAKMK